MSSPKSESLETLYVHIAEPISVAIGIIKAETRMSKRQIVEEALLDYIAKHGLNTEQPRTW